MLSLKITIINKILSKRFLETALHAKKSVYLYLRAYIEPHKGRAYLLSGHSALKHPYHLITVEPSPLGGNIPKTRTLASLPDNGLDKDLPWNYPTIEKILPKEETAGGHLTTEVISTRVTSITILSDMSSGGTNHIIAPCPTKRLKLLQALPACYILYKALVGPVCLYKPVVANLLRRAFCNIGMGHTSKFTIRALYTRGLNVLKKIMGNINARTKKYLACAKKLYFTHYPHILSIIIISTTRYVHPPKISSSLRWGVA